MAELLEGLEQLARERGSSLQRASQELTAERDGFLIVVRETGNFIGLLSDFWAVMEARCRNGGVPAKHLLRVCDLLLNMGAYWGEYLDLAIERWHERDQPAAVGESAYADVQAARQRLSTLVEVVRETRKQAAAGPRISAEPEQVQARIKQADEGSEWVSLADAISRMRQKGPAAKE
jgi:hypothetical protein